MVPIGWQNNKAKVYFYDNVRQHQTHNVIELTWRPQNPNDQNFAGPGFHSSTLPANATVSNRLWTLSNSTTSTGKSFTLQACNSTALSLTTNQTQGSCGHTGCYTTYTNWIRIINPDTNRCLTIQSFNTNASALQFQPCNAHPSNTSQMFQTSQTVSYPPAIVGGPPTIGGVEVDNIQNANDAAVAWALSRGDNRTVQVVQADYTQVGLSADLVPA